jgi:hypothetical protein
MGQEARLFATFARKRVHAYLDGRLVVLRLLADGLTLPAEPPEIAAMYTGRYGTSPLTARLAGEDQGGPSARTVETALLEWVRDMTPGAPRSIVHPV